jgi:hypothetical protein
MEVAVNLVAGEFDRIVQNALLYTNPKSPRLQEVKFVVLSGRLHVYAADDYVVMTDSCAVEDPDKNVEFSLTIDDTKKLGEWIKEDKKVVHKSTIDVKFRHTLVELSSQDSDRELSLPFIKEPAFKTWDFLFELLSDEKDMIPMYSLAYRPDRMARLARLKADKEAPLDMRGVAVNGHLVVQFKLGDTITGAIVPVERSIVDDRFLWPE